MTFAYLKCRPRNHFFPIVSWLIMIFQGMNPFDKNSTSHRALLYNIEGETFVIDSTGGEGVNVQPLAVFLEEYKIIEQQNFIVGITEMRLIEWVCDLDGILYDRWQIVGLVLKSLGFISFNMFGSNYRRLICNEVIVNFLHEFIGVEVKDSDNWDLVMTDNLVNRLLKEGVI